MTIFVSAGTISKLNRSLYPKCSSPMIYSPPRMQRNGSQQNAPFCQLSIPPAQITDDLGQPALVSPNCVQIYFDYNSEVRGDYGFEQTTRSGKAILPVNILVDMLVKGLLETDYELSSKEIRKLLLAIVSGSEPKEPPKTSRWDVK